MLKCNWKPPLDKEWAKKIEAGYTCNEDAWPGSKLGFCIFHTAAVEKTTDNDRAQFAKLFGKKLTRDEVNRTKLQYFDFQGYIFPPKFDLLKALQFRHTIRFTGASFGEQTDFTNTQFFFTTVFDFASFGPSTIFKRTKFNGDLTTFTMTSFGDNTDFSEALFGTSESVKRVTIFRRAQFGQNTNFDRTIFHGMTAFEACRFGDNTNFSQTKFAADVVFNGCIFLQGTRFIYTAFHGKTNFTGIDKETKSMFTNIVDFRFLRQYEATSIEFRTVDLSKARFMNTEVEKIDFIDVDWCVGNRRLAVYDEFHVEKDAFDSGILKDYPRIQELYRQLIINHNKKLQYRLADSFHAGWFEMEKMQQPWWRRIVPNIYKAVCNYGVDYWQAFRWLAYTMILSGLIYTMTGFDLQTDAMGGKYSIPAYYSDAIAWEKPSKNILRDFRYGQLYSLSVATFQKFHFAKVLRPTYPAPI